MRVEAGRLPVRAEAVNTARSLGVGGGGPTTRESRGSEHSEVTWCGWRSRPPGGVVKHRDRRKRMGRGY